MSQQTKKTFNIFHKVTCKSQYVFLFNGKYIMQNPIRWKIRDLLLNLRLSNHRKDFNNQKAIPACNHSKIHGHNFMRHAKFTLIEQLTELSNVNKDIL